MRIGILTSGGDCQALNATMSSFVKTIYQHNEDVEIIGFKYGYRGLMYEDYKIMDEDDFKDIANIGGTILGTSRCPFKKMRIIENGFDKVAAMKNTYKKLKLDCLVVLGGNGSIKSANMLSEEGLNVIALPKTIDNDTYGTDYTFGYQSANDIATHYLDAIHTTAASHNRVFVIEVMGHKVGHICLSAGISANADVILIPEIPYDIEQVANAISKVHRHGKNYAIIACAEGAISKKDALLTKKEYKAKVASRNGQSVIYEVANELQKYINSEIRVSAIGHAQRGGSPCPYDRMMATRFGIKGAKLVLENSFGRLVVLKGQEVTSIPLLESAGKLKYVDPSGELVQAARFMGISFGD